MIVSVGSQLTGSANVGVGGDPDHSHCKGAFKGKKPLVEKNVSYYIIGRY